ncbi:MAG: ATP-binding cassette domain-containing protein [Armatimonadota bacterium]|nr:ATP-binding cassette domain-containing protein [bacterium]
MLLSLNKVSFTYDGAIDPLFDEISLSFPTGWTGIVGANGAGKTTLLRLTCGELQANTGWIHRPETAIYCSQRTDEAPCELQEFLQSLDPDACEIRGRMEIEADWYARWNTLSHGERKRAQIAVALWRDPDILALDEPTNHIDADARNLLINALGKFRGIGLLVSHDRELLDRLCSQCIFVEPPNVIMRPGNYTQSSQQAEMEDMYARDKYEQAKAAAEKLKKEYTRRREEASHADNKRSKRHLNPRDHDAAGKIDAARVSGADGKAGRLANQMAGRVQRAQSVLDDFDIKRRYETHFWLPGSKSTRDLLFTLPAGRIELGEGKYLSFPELSMTPQDRIGITGPNGSGKSTLIRHLLNHISLPEGKLIYLPQEIDMAQSRQIMEEVNSLPRERLGRVMTIVSCLGSRPARLIGSTESSPGEIRKILLALGVSNAPHLIIMDEPTNHLDLPAIKCLENALADCPCGLLLVSHDFQFLSRLTSIRWQLSPDKAGNVRLHIADGIS